MAINFPSNPSNEQQVTLAGTTYTYNSAKTKWEIRNLFTSSVFDSAEVVSIVDSSYVSSRQEAAGVTVYANRSSLPASGNTAGDQAYVTANNRLYIWNGTGWYNIALLNLAPSIQSVLDSDNNQSPFSLAIDGTPTTITITATDSDGDPITYGYNADSNFNGLATLSQANNVFTITPFSQDSATTSSGTITFTATDDVNVASSGVQTFTLTFLSPLWDETILSIGTSSTNSLNNSAFIDRSTNSHTVTSTGTPTQTAFHPYLDNWSVKFDGTGDYLQVNNSSDFAFGTGDFTVEAWVNYTTWSGSGGQAIISTGTSTSAAAAGQWYLTAYGATDLRFGRHGAPQYTSVTSSLSVNSWNHIAITREGTTLRIFINGVSLTTSDTGGGMGSYDISNSSGYLYIGEGASFSAANGYISNVRIIKGTALYTANFTPPTEKLTAVTNTVFLSNQSNRFIDNSTNGATLTVNGNPEISAFNPYGQESEYAVGENKGSSSFDGAGDYLSLASSSDFGLGNGSWTVECWYYLTSSVASANKYLFDFGTNGLRVQLYNGTFYLVTSAGDTISQSQSGLNVNQWYHFAGVRDGNTIRLFINGLASGTAATSENMAATTLRIGAYGGNSNYNFPGYISDFRIVKGTAVYTSGFTPPTTPVGNTNASLYLPMDNAGVFDKTGNSELTLFGNTSTSTTQTKYADTAIYFDGNDYMLAGPNEFYDNDFTIELWWYPTSTSRQALMHGSWGNDWSIGIDYSSTASNQKIGIWASSNGSSWNLINSDSGGNGIGSETINQNAWNHIAYTRSGTTWRLFVNGVLDVELTSISGSIARPTQQIAIGAWWSDGSMVQINGYIENFQILKGVAKYTANFTPPTQEQGRTYQAED